MFIYYAVGFFFVVFIWLGILTYLIFKTRSHYLNLTKRTKGHKIDEILDGILEHNHAFSKELDSLKKELHEIIKQSHYYFQKLGLVRFNAFERGGNDQSFVLALLDKNDRGIVVNFIYTHEGIRIYTKKVKDGKGEEYILSEEENKAVRHASN